jgi:hypothetical protein
MTIKDGWYTLEPRGVYVPPYEQMTREEIDAMVERETRIFNAVEAIRKKAKQRARREKKAERKKGK